MDFVKLESLAAPLDAQVQTILGSLPRLNDTRFRKLSLRLSAGAGFNFTIKLYGSRFSTFCVPSKILDSVIDYSAIQVRMCNDFGRIIEPGRIGFVRSAIAAKNNSLGFWGIPVKNLATDLVEFFASGGEIALKTLNSCLDHQTSAPACNHPFDARYRHSYTEIGCYKCSTVWAETRAEH